ncbi:MAG: acyl-CoA dehydrogenase family protein [Candidatus Eremiobacteraeota bacterium]|nr:acyl-CoA dehydrogenase family protein [Candidatus Eremiobacteraeota bacterium]
MDFKLTGEQILIKDSVERFVQAQKASDNPWRAFVQLGWLGIGAPEEVGGFGGPLETLLLMEAFGRGLVTEPYLEGVVFAGALLRAAARTDLLEELVGGERRFAVAYEEAGTGYDPARVSASVEPAASGYLLRGCKDRVVAPPEATTFLVTARCGDGVALFAVAPGAAGVTRADYRTEDGRNATRVAFDAVRLASDAAVGAPAAGLELLAYGLDHAAGALCAEAVGVMSVLHETTLRYLKERTQFGVPIGSFQALQHRMADMYVELELARSMAYVAAMTLANETEAAPRGRGVSAAKVQIARSGRFIGQNAIQLHGAIAMTAEYKIGDYFKRMTTLERLFGDADYHLRRYRSLTPSGEAVRIRSSQIDQSTLERNDSAYLARSAGL